MKIVSGPNPSFYVATAFFALLSWSGKSPWPIVGWVVFCATMIPLCIWLHAWNKKQDQKMLADFPHDDYIQRKYTR